LSYFSLYLKDLQTVISSLEVDKTRLQKEVESSSSKLEGAIKIAAEAHQEVDSLKDELEGLRKRLKDEEASRLAAEARAIEKDELLRQSSLALLSNPLLASFPIFALSI
jgi:peptidoglycan hydrolase CwlO-like protein